jgi:hypothetical protein
MSQRPRCASLSRDPAVYLSVCLSVCHDITVAERVRSHSDGPSGAPLVVHHAAVAATDSEGGTFREIKRNH